MPTRENRRKQEREIEGLEGEMFKSYKVDIDNVTNVLRRKGPRTCHRQD
jgi:hypothetical protein